MNASETRSYRFDRFVVDSRSACLRREGALVPLRPKSFDVLLHLVRNAGRLVPKDELIDKVWPDVIVTENSLVQCIKDIRQTLNDDAQTMLETVAKRGYLFTPAVVEIDADLLKAGEWQPPPATAGPVDPASTPSAPASTSAGVSSGRWKIGAVAAGIAAALVVAGGLWWASGPAVAPATQTTDPGQSDPIMRLSIAVLPFGADNPASDDYFSTGMSEDIAAALGRYPDLAVASPKLVSRFQSVGASAEDIERQLKIRYLVEGNVRRSSDGVRIVVRLTDLTRGTLLWSNAYDVPAETILAVQDEIAARIAGALAVKLTHLEQIRAANKSAGSMEAYDFVLRGRQLLTRLNRTSYSQARTLFERAIALDPRYAAAYIGLGRVDLSAVALGWTDDAGEALKRAERLARKAISLDEFSPAAHVLLGRTYARMGEYDRAIDALKRAVALNPSEPDSHAGLGDAYLWNGEPESAIKALETAVSIDPRLSAEDLFSLGAAYFIDGNVAASIRVFERVTTRNEGNPFIYAMLAAVYAESDRELESRSAAAEVRKLNPLFDVDTFGSLFKKAEHRDKMASALKKAGL
jgi:adenylate cyclase